MKVKFYGTRGSIPVCEGDFLKYGGNTSCVRIQFDQEEFIVDAGTGIRNLGKEIFKNDDPKKVNVLFTHFHQDHIQGFQFFRPVYDPSYSIQLMCDDEGLSTLEWVLAAQMHSQLFPVSFDKLKAKITFNAVDRSNIEMIDLQHPGGCIGYKFTSDSGETLVYMVDHEHKENIDEKYIDFCQDADVLIHDGQYTSEEYKINKGWGHSNIDQALNLAKSANVRQLIITHHDPDHNDSFLDEMERYSITQFPDASLAKEGMEISILKEEAKAEKLKLATT